jgi:hypothetical protein
VEDRTGGSNQCDQTKTGYVVAFIRSGGHATMGGAERDCGNVSSKWVAILDERASKPAQSTRAYEHGDAQHPTETISVVCDVTRPMSKSALLRRKVVKVIKE